MRETLLEGDFATCLKLLQNYPAIDVNVLVALADKTVEKIDHEKKHAEYLRKGKVR